MQDNHSPLRYPGGKASIINLMIRFIKSNHFSLPHYAEPCAGGCGLALGLLIRGYVSQIHINDIDRGIWSFWHSVLNCNSKFIRHLENTHVCMDEWYRQREIIRHPTEHEPFELGFATFFMNRTNRSGIIKAGVIGGLQQNGNYLLDCRFNKNQLARRIERIGLYNNKIHLTNLDALDFLDLMNKQEHSTLVCIDPPYYKQGSSLYTNFYKDEDHALLAKKIHSLLKPWILTYDNEPAIKALYNNYQQVEFNLNYFAQTKRVGTELMVVSDDIILPENYLSVA